MTAKTENNLLELFKTKFNNFHYLEIIRGTFWDSENIITKNYKKIKDNIESNNNNEEKKIFLEEAYKTLLNINDKIVYYRYLMIEYTLSQPTNIDQLINEYYSIILPYYLFLLKNESNEDFIYCVLDFINYSINIYDKNGMKHSFEINEISDIDINDYSIIIERIDTNQKIVLIPQIIHNLKILYLLIIYMASIKNKRDSYQKEIKKVNEINQNLKNNDIKTLDQKIKGINNYFNEIDISKLKLISNDSFVPKSILFSVSISFEQNKKVPDKFLLLGRRYIYIFKNESLKELNIIIPLIIGYTIFEFNDDFRKIDIVCGKKYHYFYIYERNIYEDFKEKLLDIIEGNTENIFEKDDVFKCSKAIYADKILGGDLENTPIFDMSKSKLEILVKKFLELSNIKNEIEKECLKDEEIKKQIEESKE